MANLRTLLLLAAFLTPTAGYAQDVWEAFLTQRDSKALARDGRFVWIATSGGALRWDADGIGSDESRYTLFLPQDGLASALVTDVAIDRHGNKWFTHGDPDVGVSILAPDGSWKVLGSFDGLGLNPGKRSNVVYASGDSVWIGTESGATLFINQRRDVLLTQDDDGLISDNILSIVSKDGETWLGTDRGISRVNRFGIRNYQSSVDSLLRDNRINTLVFGPDDRLWVGTDDGLNFVEDDEVTLDFAYRFLNNLTVRSIDFEDSSGTFVPWFATNDGPYRRNVRVATQSGSGDPIGTPGLSNEVMVDSSGDIWLANGDRWLFDYVPSQSAWRNRRVPGLVTNYIADIVVDKSGVVWTANAENVDQAPAGAARGLHMRQTDGTWTNITIGRLSNESETITCVAVDSAGNRWFGSRRSANVTIGNLIKLPADVNTVPIAEEFDYFNIESGAFFDASPVFNLEVDAQSNKWIAVTRQGVATLGSQDILWSSFTPGDCLLPVDEFGDRPIDIAFTSDGRAWVALEEGGLTVIDPGDLANPADDICEQIIPETEGVPLPRNQRVIRADRFDRVWIGTTEGGLYMYDTRADLWYAYTVNNSSGFLPDNRIRAIAFDSADRIWVGTFGGGLAVLQPDLETWLEPYRVEDNVRRGSGLTDNEIQSIHINKLGSPEGKDEIWIATWGGGVNKLIFDGEQTVSIPTERAIVSPYPNPFRSAELTVSSIGFRNAPVGCRIEIYTLDGQPVTTIDGPQTEGSPDPRWAFENDFNVRVVSGIYLFLIRLDGAIYQEGKIAYID